MGIIGSPFEHLPLTAEGLSNKARAVRADVVGRLGDQAERLRKLRDTATAWRAFGTTAIPDGVYAPIPELSKKLLWSSMLPYLRHLRKSGLIGALKCNIQQDLMQFNLHQFIIFDSKSDKIR